MKTSILHSIVFCLAALVLPLMSACCSNEDCSPEDAADVTLMLNIETIEETRAVNASLPDNEKMHSVRVIILHDNGTVEHNKYYPLEEARGQKNIMLKVKPDEKKKIYLFANEESVPELEGVSDGEKSLSSFLDSYGVGSSGFNEAVNALYFAPDYIGKSIPMSSVYEVDVPEQGLVERVFYMVRIATKFTVNFFNMRGEAVTVENFSIGKYADRNYLMAHVGSYPEPDRYPTWIDWLNAVSDASSENDSYETTEAAGWLKDYGLPAQANHQNVYNYTSPLTVAEPVYDVDNIDDLQPGKASVTFYLPESKNLKEGTSDEEQEYTLTINITGAPGPFVCKLPNLKALFRNTHVVVNVTMHKNHEFIVDVIPFTSVSLTPDYGLKREEFTGYIVGTDKDGNKCWYDGNYYDPEKAVPLYLGPDTSPEEFVTINGKEYLLVYADYARTAAKLDHFFEKETRRKYLLTPAGITGYKLAHNGDMYLNKLQQRVWLDFGGDPNGDDNEKAIYAAFAKVDLNLKCCRVLYEWDRQDWNYARWNLWKGYYPKYWFDVLGNRYPWSQGDTPEKRKAILKDWTNYLDSESGTL